MTYKIKRSPAEKQKKEKQADEKYEKIMEQFGSIEAYQEAKSHKKSPTVEKPKIKSIDPQQVREKRKQAKKVATEQHQKQMMTQDYAYTDKFNTKGPHSRVAEATAKGVRIARRGGGRAYGKNS